MAANPKDAFINTNGCWLFSVPIALNRGEVPRSFVVNYMIYREAGSGGYSLRSLWNHPLGHV